MADEKNSDVISEPPWKFMSVEELQHEYSPSGWSKRYSSEEVIAAHIRSTLKVSQAAKTTTLHRCDVRYADGPKALLDIYGEDLPKDSPILVYVHGGYWQWEDGGRHISAVMVQPLYRQGILTVVVGYDIAPQVGVRDMVLEAEAAIRWACDLARQRGSRSVVLAGWSAGAQLITQVMCEPYVSNDGEGALGMIRGLVTFSGIFDLRPLVYTTVNDPLKLNIESAWQLSPLRKAGLLGKNFGSRRMKLLAMVGEHESNEFKRQTRQYCQECEQGGVEGRVVELEGTDHFSIIEDLSNPDCHVTRTIIPFILTCSNSIEKEEMK